MADVSTLVTAIEDKQNALKSLNYKVQFDLTDGGTVFIDATGPSLVISEDAGDADAILRLSSDNLLKLIDGRLNPMIAFSTGRLKVQGSRGVALKLASLLDD